MRAVDLNAPERTRHLEIDVDGPLDLRAIFPGTTHVGLFRRLSMERFKERSCGRQMRVPVQPREDRIEGYAREWTRLLEDYPEDPTWDLSRKLIQSVGDNGDAGALDQVQALAQEPAAALAMVLQAPTDGRSASGSRAGYGRADFLAGLADERVPKPHSIAILSASSDAMRVCDQSEAKIEAVKSLARRIGLVLTLHPELCGHFGAAFVEAKFAFAAHWLGRMP